MENNILKKYNDFLLERTYNEIDSIINESKFDLKNKFLKLLKTIIKSGHKNRKRLLIYGIASLISLTSLNSVSGIFNSDKDIKELSMDAGVSELIEKELKKDTAKSPKVKSNSITLDATNLRLSQDGWDSIRHEEGDIINKGEPVLTAYKIGDGMITIGWGHAERIRKSKYKVGDTITRSEAQKLLKGDLKVAADGVRKIFKQWKNKGIDVKISQDQFDVLVSIAFNSGVSSLRKSPIIRHLKKGDHQKAGESIKKFKVSKKFPGLLERRKNEYQKFMSYESIS